MAYTPRTDEVEPIMAILDSDEHADAKSMAKAVLKQAYALFTERESFVVFPQGGVVGYGPYASQKDAERAWVKGIGETYAGTGRLLRVRPFDPTEAERGGTCVCGHSKDLHADRGKCCAYYVGAQGPKAKTRPHLPRCACTGFEQRKV